MRQLPVVADIHSLQGPIYEMVDHSGAHKSYFY